MKPIPKPKHLGPEYADQFKDESVASAYLYRPPYPAELFDVLDSLIQGKPRLILDMGCGTGEIAIPMAGRVDRVDAVDQSEAMLKMAQTRPGWDQENIRWVCTGAEYFDYQERYGLIVAGASLHWMDWYAVLPKMRRSLLQTHGLLAIVGGRQQEEDPWLNSLREIIPRYSTNQDFKPYDFIEELESRSLFRVVGRPQDGAYGVSHAGQRLRRDDPLAERLLKRAHDGGVSGGVRFRGNGRGHAIRFRERGVPGAYLDHHMGQSAGTSVEDPGGRA